MQGDRTIIRLKHPLAADEEIHSVIPDDPEGFERAVAELVSACLTEAAGSR